MLPAVLTAEGRDRSMKCYIVIELGKEPKIIGVYKTKKAAEAVAYADSTAWRNVIEKPILDR